MHDPMTVAFDVPSYELRRRWPWLPHVATVWHVDPETDGSDDSCGWFMRCRHGDKAVLERIVSRFEFDWDRVHEGENGHVYHCGWFRPDGRPHFSPVGITVGLFHAAAGVAFAGGDGFDWPAAERFMRRHLAEIIRFAENPTDSLHDAVTRKFETGCGEEYTPRRRDERIRSMASVVYAWILRAERPWYRHPRWHVHHWRVQVHGLQLLRRWLLSRCQSCGRGFRWGESVVGLHWSDPPRRWLESFRGERGLIHTGCPHPNAVTTPPAR
jgi:hypothetical protein